jgi:hypothetical protein
LPRSLPRHLGVHRRRGFILRSLARRLICSLGRFTVSLWLRLGFVT